MAVFSVAAHTFYDKDRTVIIKNQKHTLKPYQTLSPNGEVLIASDVVKGIDQADCVSGFFVGRHLVSIWDTITGAHYDYDGQEFQTIKFSDHLRITKNLDGQFPVGSALRHFTNYAQSQLCCGRFSCYHYGDIRRVLTTYAPWLLMVVRKIYADYLIGKTGGEEYRPIVEEWLQKKVAYYDAPNEVQAVINGLSNLNEPTKTDWFNGLMVAQKLSVEQVNFIKKELGEERITQLPHNLPILNNGLHDMLAIN